MATIPAQRTWATGDTVTAVAFNGVLRDAQQFLLNRPRVLVYDTVGVSLDTSSGEVLLTWNSESFDTDGMHSPSVSPERITFTTSGVYEVILHIDWQPLNDSNAATRFATVQKNHGTSVTMGTADELGSDALNVAPSDTIAPQVNHIYLQHFFTAGDYVTAVVRNRSGTSLNVNNGNDTQTFFAARWLGTQ
jgi:hypothetical protein